MPVMIISEWWAAATHSTQATLQGLAQVAGLGGARRSWAGAGRVWVQVNGLDGSGGERLAALAPARVGALPGVRRALLNRPLARLVVELEDEGPSVAQICALLQEVETQVAADCEATGAPFSAGSAGGGVPGDAAVTATRMLAVAADTVGVAAAVAARVLRVPKLPAAVAAAVTLADHQPRLRRAVEAGLGPEVADVVLAVSMAAAQVLTQAPASLAVDLAMRAFLLAEAQAGRRAWAAHEPVLAVDAECERRFPAADRPVPRPPGPVETYADRAAVAAVVGAGVLGGLTGRPGIAADAVLVATPKATRTARESFAATLGRVLSDRGGTLILRGDCLRRLDRVDALLIDPRALLSDRLTVAHVEGVDPQLRTRVWQAAQQDVAEGLLKAGWHQVQALSPAHGLPDLPDGQVAVIAVPDPLAAAVLAAARSGGLSIASLDVAALGDLRAGFDSLHDAGGPADAALLRSVRALQAAGRTVALLAVDAHEGLAAADVALAVHRDGVAPAWTADVLTADLGHAWRLVRALPAARAVSRRSVELSAGGSLLGALLMLPGVRGSGPGPVVGAAAAGLLTGRSAAMGVAALPLPAAAPVMQWHNMTSAQVLAMLPEVPDRFAVTAAPGAGPAASGPLAGPQAMQVGAHSPVRALSELVGAVRQELNDPLTPVLATGAAASAVLGSPVDAVLVGSVMLGNATLSAVQRLRAERLLSGLLSGQQAPARVVQAGPAAFPGTAGAAGDAADGALAASAAPGPEYLEVPAAGLLVGELIQVRSGEIVPADARILAADGVEVDESSLTGESLPVGKQAAATPGAPLAERSCLLFEGTVVLTGVVTAVVVAVGSGTEAGRAAAVSPGHPHSGLQVQLGRLTSKVLPVTLAGGAAVTVIGLLRGAGVRQAVTSGVSIAVAAVPEGLPLVATLAQQAAARRLGGRGILVRSPRAVEALGRVDTICFDKTGTLTQNVLQVREVLPCGKFDRSAVLAAAAAASPPPQPDRPLVSATDAAVLAAAESDPPPRQAQLSFRAGRAFSAGLTGRWLYVKGAPELIAGAGSAVLRRQVHALAGQGLRVIAVARRRLTVAQAAAAVADEQQLVDLCQAKLEMVGLLGIADTPRPEAVGLLTALTEQGLGVRVITGDHPLTATAIVADLGHQVSAAQVITGPQWAALSRAGQRRAAEDFVIFARMSPEQKVQVVKVLEGAGHVCAMLGDGANDAAAIRAASIGIGVASHGSDPARGAADVVLTDGRIGALLDALEEGAQLWHRVQAATSVLLGGNAGEVAFSLIGTAITGRAPLNARQLLLVNMFTDALPAAAVAVSPPRRAATPGPQAVPDVRGLDPAALWKAVAIRGAATTLGATAGWAMASVTGLPRRASTVGLVALVATQLGQTLLDSRSPLVIVTAAGSLAALGTVISIPGISQVLGCTPLGPLGWTQSLGAAAGATAAAAVAPRLLSKLNRADDQPKTQATTKAPVIPAAAPTRAAATRSKATAPAPPTATRKVQPSVP